MADSVSGGSPTLRDQVSKFCELMAGYHATQLLEIAHRLGVWDAAPPSPQASPSTDRDIHSQESMSEYAAAVTIDLPALFGDLVRLETDLWNRVDARIAREHGFPLAWMEVMRVISTTPDCRVLDVAAALFITVGGASKVVDKVEGAGWCRRLPNPDDGRSQLIELTASGRRVLEAAHVTFGEVLEINLGAAAPQAELLRLSSTLGRLRRHLITADRATAQASR